MKHNNIFRRFLVLLLCAAIAVTYMPFRLYAYAEDGAAEANEAAQEAASETKTEAVEAKSSVEAKDAAEADQAAEEKTEPAAETATEKKTETAEAAAEAKPEENSSAQEAASGEIAAAQAKEETSEAVTLKAAAVNQKITLTYHLYVMGDDGEFHDFRQLPRTISKPGTSTTSLTLAIANNSKFEKSVNVNGTVYNFSKTWAYADGSSVAFPLSMTYEEACEAADDNNKIDVALYAKYTRVRSDITVTLNFVNIRHTDGSVTSATRVETVGGGNSFSISKTTFESLTGLRAGQTFTADGVKYTYTGKWTDDKGNVIDSDSAISFYNRDGSTSGNSYYLDGDMKITFSPVYEAEKIAGFDAEYIDNVSTGSGSWSNADAEGTRSEFGTYTHTFRDPEDVETGTPVDNYNFLYWEDDATGAKYYAGDKYTYAYGTDLDEDGNASVTMHAWWQPSVTVAYHYGDNKAEVEKFEDISLYDGFTIEDGDYLVWYDADGNKIDEDTVYTLPEITADPVERKVIDVYAKKPEPAAVVPAGTTTDGTTETETTTPAESVSRAAKAAAAVAAVIPDTPVPSAALTDQQPIVIADRETPLAQGTWALLNLIAAILAAAGGLVALLRRREEEDEQDAYAAQDEDEADNRAWKMFAAKMAGAIAGIVSVIAFILTEDMSLQMVLTDKWTILMAVLLAAQIVAAALNKKASKADDEAENAEAAAASAN